MPYRMPFGLHVGLHTHRTVTVTLHAGQVELLERAARAYAEHHLIDSNWQSRECVHLADTFGEMYRHMSEPQQKENTDDE